MAMTMTMEGLDQVSDMLDRLGNRAEEVASGSLFKGAGVVADAFKSATGSIRTETFRGKREHRMPSPEEKAALSGKSGIAKFKKNGNEVDTIVGIAQNAGYATLGKRKVAVREIARSINSGTSFMQKQPVFRRAVSISKGAASAAIVSAAEKMFNEIINGK